MDLSLEFESIVNHYASFTMNIIHSELRTDRSYSFVSDGFCTSYAHRSILRISCSNLGLHKETYIKYSSVNCIDGLRMADKVEKPANPMKYPYTFTAKLAQFPFKFYIQNQWLWRYYMFGFFCSLPVFYKIHKLGN